MYEFRGPARWAFQVHSPLKDTMSTSSMTVSFKMCVAIAALSVVSCN